VMPERAAIDAALAGLAQPRYPTEKRD